MSDFVDLFERIDRVCLRASHGDGDERLVGDLEDVLAEGYILAMAGEARSRRLGHRLEVLVGELDQPGVPSEARRVAAQRRTVDHRVRVLRRRLSVVRDHFVRLGEEGRSLSG